MRFLDGNKWFRDGSEGACFIFGQLAFGDLGICFFVVHGVSLGRFWHQVLEPSGLRDSRLHEFLDTDSRPSKARLSCCLIGLVRRFVWTVTSSLGTSTAHVVTVISILSTLRIAGIVARTWIGLDQPVGGLSYSKNCCREQPWPQFTANKSGCQSRISTFTPPSRQSSLPRTCQSYNQFTPTI